VKTHLFCFPLIAVVDTDATGRWLWIFLRGFSEMNAGAIANWLSLCASALLWVLVVVSIGLVGWFAWKVYQEPPHGETVAERQTRIQSVFDLLKSLLGTVAVGMLTMALDQGIKQREEILKERDQVTKKTEAFSKLLPNALA
jgi:hypothetical protein